MKTHRNIPIFIPHLGCPNQCVFCNQRSISGCEKFDLTTVSKQIEDALSTIPQGVSTEIAFFGGSFTGIERRLMVELLEIAQHYVRQGSVESIRLSTRPDYINEEILEILSRYTVKHIELGLQSTRDTVLQETRRGHTAEQAEKACRAVVSAGFSLTGQMMIGLPGSTEADERKTAEDICTWGASSARIYPTVVFRNTPLADMMERGSYRPLSLADAVTRSAAVLRIFEEQGVPCIRIGLCASEALTSFESVCGGPNHPALGELVWNELYYCRLKQAVTENSLQGRLILLTVPTREISKVVGQNRCNLSRLETETGARAVRVVGDKQTKGIRITPYADP